MDDETEVEAYALAAARAYLEAIEHWEPVTRA